MHGCARPTSGSARLRGCAAWPSLLPHAFRPAEPEHWARWRPIGEALAAEWLTLPTAGNAREDLAEVVLHSSGRGSVSQPWDERPAGRAREPSVQSCLLQSLAWVS